MPHDREVVCLNPAGCWDFLSLLFLSLYLSLYLSMILNQVPHRGASQLIFLDKCMLSCAALVEASLISTHWREKACLAIAHIGNILNMQRYADALLGLDKQCGGKTLKQSMCKTISLSVAINILYCVIFTGYNVAHTFQSKSPIDQKFNQGFFEARA